MGPKLDRNKSRSIVYDLLFDPDNDLLVYRKRVATLVELIATRAQKGQDKL